MSSGNVVRRADHPVSTNFRGTVAVEAARLAFLTRIMHVGLLYKFYQKDRSAS